MEEESCRHRNPVEQLGFAQLRHVATLDPELSDGAYRTYALYLMYAQQQGKGWPSRERLAEERKVNDATISRHNAELERLGYISRQRRMGKSSITIIEALDQLPRLQKFAADYLQDRAEVKAQRDADETEDIAPVQHKTLRQCNREEELIEEEPKKNNQTPAAKGDRNGPINSDPKPLINVGALLRSTLKVVSETDGEGQPEARHLERSLQKAFGVKGRMAAGPRKRLERGVEIGDPESPGVLKLLPSPADLYEQDPMFVAYVAEGIEWARDPKSFGRPVSSTTMRNACVGWICNYERPWSGWLARQQQWSAEPETNETITEEEGETDGNWDFWSG